MFKKLVFTIAIIVAGECIIVSGIFILFMYLSNNPGSVEEEIKAYKESKLKESKFKETSLYNITAEIDISGNTVIVKENIALKKPSREIPLYIPSANTAVTAIKQVRPGNMIEKTSRDGMNITIFCKSPQNSISLEYEITLDTSASILSLNNGFYHLTNFLITPAVYRDAKPVRLQPKPFGDPYLYDINNYYILFKADKSLNIYAPGEKSEHIFGMYKITIFEAKNLRDFPAVLFNSADVYKAKYDNINVHYINSRSAKPYVEAALAFAGNKIGPYPYSDLYVVKAPLEQKGMEFSNMIFISDKCFTNNDDLKRVIFHEVLHQWFYGIIGTDQINEPFFDEGLVNYLSMLMAGSHISGTNGKNFLNMSLYDYTSRDQYYSLAYNEAASYFYTIHKKLGNTFYGLLGKLYNENKFKMVYFDTFTKYVNNLGRK